MLVAAEVRRPRAGRHQLRRQGAPRKLRAGRSVPRPHRRHGRLCPRPEDRRRDPRRRRARQDAQGALQLLGHRHRRTRSKRARTASPRSRSTCSTKATPRPTRAAGRRCSRISSIRICNTCGRRIRRREQRLFVAEVRLSRRNAWPIQGALRRGLSRGRWSSVWLCANQMDGR